MKRLEEIILKIKQYEEEKAEKPNKIRISPDYYEDVVRECSIILNDKEPNKVFGIPLLIDPSMRTFEVY